MTEYQAKSLNMLNHVLRNGTTRIEGRLKGIESDLKFMWGALETYREEFEDEKNPAEKGSNLDGKASEV